MESTAGALLGPIATFPLHKRPRLYPQDGAVTLPVRPALPSRTNVLSFGEVQLSVSETLAMVAAAEGRRSCAAVTDTTTAGSLHAYGTQQSEACALGSGIVFMSSSQVDAGKVAADSGTQGSPWGLCVTLDVRIVHCSSTMLRHQGLQQLLFRCLLPT